jgi:predicted nucleic acid-binding Zn ribbon protein
MQKFSDAPLEEHPGCGGKVSRLLSAPALLFKGSGWYITDYARGSSSQASSDGKSDAKAKTEAKTDSASEGKPAESKPASTKPD